MRLCGVVLMMLALVGISAAQTPVPAKAKAKSAPAAPASRNPATLAQLMKGILYPNSNVIFFAQSDNPNDVPQAKDPATAVNPLASSYGKWEAVENSSLALVEAAGLLTVPGRKCSNGRLAPVANPDWPKLVQGSC